MWRKHRDLAGKLALLAVALCVPAAPRAARAELVFGACGGVAATADGEIRLAQGEGTRLTFHGVSWAGDSFAMPIYYGVRLTYWIGGASGWGVAADFTHAKMYARRDRSVRVTGTRGGSPVDAVERLDDTFESLEFSHGYNLLTLNGVHRWFPKGRGDRTLPGRTQPYVSVGLGLAVPHVEAIVADAVTSDVQIAGLAVQGGAGASVAFASRLSLFAEYRLSYADVSARLARGGSLGVQPWTNHFMLGGAVRLSR